MTPQDARAYGRALTNLLLRGFSLRDALQQIIKWRSWWRAMDTLGRKD